MASTPIRAQRYHWLVSSAFQSTVKTSLQPTSLTPATKALLGCSPLGSLLFTATYLIEGATRPGYDAWQQAIGLRSLLRRHPIVGYFVMTFAISWGGALLVVAPTLLAGQPITQTEGLLMFPVMLLGPSISDFMMTALIDGKAGLRELFSRMRRWRLDPRWYLVLLLPPVLILAVLALMSRLVSPVFTPNLFPAGIAIGLVAGMLEEIGWTGFAFPRLAARFTPLPGALLLGLLWGLWHAPVVDFLGAAYPHGAYWLPFYLAFIGLVAAMRVLISWLATNTQSVLLPQLLHASSTGSLALLAPALVSPAQEALWYAVYALCLWAVVALVVTIYGKSLGR